MKQPYNHLVVDSLQTHYHFQLNFSHERLTKEERAIIKNKIRKGEKQRLIKTIIVFTITAIIVAFFVKLAIENFVSRLHTNPS